MKGRRRCLSMRLLGLQVIWMIVMMSLIKHSPGTPKRLAVDSAVLAAGYLPTIIALFSALIEMWYPKQKSFNSWSLLALGLSILILSANLMIWYHELWMDPHGMWRKGG